jgi:hypothetical protein
MELVFRKPTTEDKGKIDEFLIVLQNDYVPPFTDEERETEISNISAGRDKAILALTERAVGRVYRVVALFKEQRLWIYRESGGPPKIQAQGHIDGTQKYSFRSDQESRL